MDEAILQAVQYATVQLPKKPRLAPWAVTVDLGDNRIQFRGAEFAYTLRHGVLVEIFRAIAPLLDGRHAVDEIAALAGSAAPPTTVIFLLRALRANGLLQEGEVPEGLTREELDDWEPALRFLAHFDGDGHRALIALRRARVLVLGTERLRGEVASALTALGVGSVEEAEAAAEADLVVACNASSAFGFFDAVNADCLALGARWLHVAVHGTSARLGPTIVPHQTACYTCYDRRTRSLAVDADAFDAFRHQASTMATPPDEGAVAPFVTLIAAQAALEVARLLTGFAPPVTIGRFYALTPRSPLTSAHDVPRLPRCPTCKTRGRHGEVWDLASAPADRPTGPSGAGEEW